MYSTLQYCFIAKNTHYQKKYAAIDSSASNRKKKNPKQFLQVTTWVSPVTENSFTALSPLQTNRERGPITGDAGQASVSPVQEIYKY